MKTITPTFLRISFFIAISFISLEMQAQTTLALGDIAFTGYNSEPAANSDEFSFVILKSTGITSGTTIYFTDRGWKSGSCGTDNFCTTADNASFPESGSEFVWTSGSSLSYGTHVKIAGAGSAGNFTCSNGSASGAVLNLSTGGDQIFALQNGSGSTTTSNGPSGTMLAAIHANKASAAGCSFSTTNWDDCTTNISVDICQSASNSNKPACLTSGTNCFVLLDGSSLEVDNGVYNCTSASSNTSSGAITSMRTAINTSSNWTTDDAAATTIPPSGCNPLPVTWAYFTANLTNFGARIEWGTASELNCSHFEIQRSYDGDKWATVQNVSGKGTKYNPTSYFYDDHFNSSSYNFVYYRIKQVDFNRSFEITPTRVATRVNGKGQYTAFEFNGNPLTTGTYVKTFLPTDEVTYISITDASGNVLYSKAHNYRGGYNRFYLKDEVPEIMAKPGMYFIKASISSETKIFKLAVQ